MKPKIRGRTSWAAALTALTATAGLAAAVGVLPGAASAAPRLAGPAVPALAWKPCDDGFQCATARVPLNYRDPRGAQLNIAVISHLATGPGPALGWLFFNGGGPEPQVSTMSGVYPILPAAWRERYNIITFDPRGMGYSTQVRCYPTVAARDKAMGNLPDGFPVDKAQEGDYQRAYATLDTRCTRVAGPLLYHDSTADIARDMNLLREAVGAPVLNFYGASYGTLLGATYANLFPSATGRMILDGNINPVAWSTGNSQVPPFSRIGSGQATQTVMTAFLDLCGKAPATACAFSAGTPAATTAKWHRLLRLARRHPVNLGGQQGTYTYADVVSAASSLGQVGQWQDNAVLLQQLWTAATGGTPAPPPAPSPAPAALPSSGPGYYAGPWNRPTASTILVVGNTGDPWTAYHDSVAMSRDLARARLLTVDGYGHTAGNNPSTCAINDIVDYTLTGALPAPGTICQQNINPFP
jgi:pimeloyl-ACP methyl ester carboxylesterase